jgi:hypothetical protein
MSYGPPPTVEHRPNVRKVIGPDPTAQLLEIFAQIKAIKAETHGQQATQGPAAQAGSTPPQRPLEADHG